MIVYLEGVDGAGKSYLFNYLQDRFRRATKFKITENMEPTINTRLVPDRVDKDRLAKTIMQWAEDDSTIYFLDRGPISDVVYRTFDQQNPVLDLYETAFLFGPICGTSVIIHCDTEDSLDRMRKRGDDNPVAHEHHQRLRYLYNQMMPMFMPVKYSIGDDMEKVAGKVLGELQAGMRNYKKVKESLENVRRNGKNVTGDTAERVFSAIRANKGNDTSGGSSENDDRRPT